MKSKIQIVITLLTLLLPLAPAALALEEAPGQLHQLRFNQTIVATDGSISRHAETPLDVLEQVANLFNSEMGLAISETASVMILCNQEGLTDGPEEFSALLDNFAVGLKIRF